MFLTVFLFSCLWNKSWMKSIAPQLAAHENHQAIIFKTLTSELYPNELNQTSEDKVWASVFKSPMWV